MSKFSKKYNIKINSMNNIVDILSGNSSIKISGEINTSELYFVNNSIDLGDINNFEDINNYAVIVKEGDRKEIRLYDKKTYTASLTDILTASELLLFFDYKAMFFIKKSIYKYNTNDIDFYIQYVNDKDYYLTFDVDTKEESINEIIDLLKNKLNISIEDKLYFNIVQNEFELFKK